MSDRRYSFYASEKADALLAKVEAFGFNRSEFISQLVEKYGTGWLRYLTTARKAKLKSLEKTKS